MTPDITVDADRRLRELRNVARALWPDRDDSRVLSELHNVLDELRAVERALGINPGGNRYPKSIN